MLRALINTLLQSGLELVWIRATSNLTPKKGGSGYGFPSRLQPNPTMKRGRRLT